MTKRIRRVVTGHNAAGRSIVLQDGEATVLSDSPDWPGWGFSGLWLTETTPASNAGDRDPITPQSAAVLRQSPTVFVMCTLPPEATLASLPEAQRSRVTRRAPGEADGVTLGGVQDHFSMHATQTIDYIVLVSGQLTCLMEDGEVTLQPGDTLIQRGTNHGWSNRGTEMAVFAVVMVQAEPL
jgi:mannose-6-phosphate isomerase-like protein (cupin superfamily)